MINNLPELALLKLMIDDNSAITEIDILPEHFENKTYGSIFQAIKTMVSDRKVVDVITLSEFMMASSGRDYLGLISDILTDSPGVPQSIKAYCEMVKGAYDSREARRIGNWLIENSKQPNATSEAIKSLMEMGRENKNYEYDINEAIKIGIKSIQEASKAGGAMLGISTGLNSLNEVLGGFHESDLIVIGARPAMGKTSILINMMTGSKVKCGCFSGEQGINQLIQRVISVESSVSLMSMRNGKLNETDYHNLNAGAVKIKQHPGMYFYDKSSPTIDDIESTARRWKFEHGIEAIYIDYIQKIKRNPKKNKIEAVGDNVGRLKDLARELEIPVIALAQVKREVESRNNRRPMMGDLSDSSDIEKEADQIIMLYRDEVYNKDTQYPGIMELNIEKNRHGAIGTVSAAWDGRYLKVSDLERPRGNE